MVYTLHDFRFGGVERLVLSDRPRGLMRIPDVLLESVFFICVRDRDGSVHFGGTGFFVHIPFVENPDRSMIYAVTDRHIIERASEYPSTFFRLNAIPSGTIEVDASHAVWHYPDNPEVDVAVLPWVPPAGRVGYQAIPPSMFATPDVIESEAIGIGDDLAILGLFTMRHGSQRNRPIARLGHISAMPTEPLVDDATGGTYDAFLAEIRSIGGLSGSPVFVMLEPGRVKNGHIVRDRIGYLLGLVRGHWHVERPSVDFAIDATETVNVGIAIVTPFADVLAVINGDELTSARREVDRLLTKKRAPVLD